MHNFGFNPTQFRVQPAYPGLKRILTVEVTYVLGQPVFFVLVFSKILCKALFIVRFSATTLLAVAAKPKNSKMLRQEILQESPEAGGFLG